MEINDYGRMRTGVLRKRAAAGDAEARRELARRGAAPELDIRQLEYHELRQLVLAWNDGRIPEDRARSRALAERAQAEVQVRFTVDMKRWNWQGPDPEPQPPPVPPWLHPLPVRCISWKRPTSSRLYPSDEDRARGRLTAAALQYYRDKAAGAPSTKERP